MQVRTFVSRYSAFILTVFTLTTGTASTVQLHAQQADEKKSGGFRRFLSTLAATALNANGDAILGQWRGAKTENDPIHGGYLNISFAFAFAADGSYQEAAYMGSRQVMFASGAYQMAGNRLVFSPQQCNFASPDLEQAVRFFPIPLDAPAQEAVSLSPLGGGRQMSLKDFASGEDWGLKPAF